MASNGVNRGGVVLHPSLPTIKETTLSWLGSELDSSIFSTKGHQTDNDPATRQLLTKNIQRHIDFDEQCLSLKSEEESEFSGIQPLPVGSDDTPPTAANEFNRVVSVDYEDLLSQSQNRPRPMIESDNEVDNLTANENAEVAHPNIGLKPVTPSDFQALIGMLDSKSLEEQSTGKSDNAAMEKIQLIRLWQLMQQEDLRRRQEAEIAVLNAQREKMKLDRSKSTNHIGLERVESDPGLDSQDLDDLESAELELRLPDSHDHQTEAATGLKDSELHEKDHEIHGDDKNFDEIPVEKEKKTFEQLLEEELQKEQTSQKDLKQPKQGPIKRPFLRKGQGLARFKGPPARKPPKPKSQTNEKLSNLALPTKAGSHIISNKTTKPECGSSRSYPSQKPSSSGTMQKSSGQSGHQRALQRVRMPLSKLVLKPSIKSNQSKEDNSLPSEMDEQPRFFRPAEDADLEEFEMLERYAEDDASFFNEPSLVVSVLQHEDDMRDEKQMSLRDRVRERRRVREEARAKMQNVAEEINHDSASYTGHTANCDVLQNDVEDQVESATEEILSPLPPQPYFASPEKQQNKVFQRKTASLIKKEKLVRPSVQSPVRSPGIKSTVFQSNWVNADLQSSPFSAFSPHVNPININGAGKLSPGEVDVQKHVGAVNDFHDEETWGDVDVSILNMTSQDPHAQKNHDEDDSSKEYKCSDYMEPENEDAENPVRDTDPAQMSSARALSLSPPPPPTSLMQKLFPSLKVPKRSLSSNTSPKSPNRLHNSNNIEASPAPAPPLESQSTVLKQKLEELENEISRFKKENFELEKLRQKQENDARDLAKEVEEFKKQKDEELARLEEYKKTEIKKLKKEKKLFEEHVIAMKTIPRKEEREEIQKLQEDLEKLRAENHSKEQKWTAANNRLRSQVSELQNKNKELQERIEVLDRLRIKEQRMQKSKCPRQPSVWQTVNSIVASTVVDIENGKNSSQNGHKQNTSIKSKKINSVKSLALSPEIAYSDARSTPESTEMAQSNAAETMHQDGKVEKVLKDGRRIVVFPNGTQKEISSDGNKVKVRFANGDIKEIFGDGSIVYYYHENGTTHTTHPDGLQVFEFPNKQVEHHFPDGTKQITFPDQTVKYLHTDGTEQTVFPDGTEMHVAANKDKTIVFANGQREIHTNSFKRREYPDGTSKTVFEDGRQETRYASGRLRVKDAHGNVIVDRIAT